MHFFSYFAPIARRSFATFAVASLLLLGAGFSQSAEAANAKKPPANVVSKKVVAPFKAASAAYQGGQYAVVLTKLEEADAVSEKTPYDQFVIGELRALAFIGLNKFPEALAIYEDHQSTQELLEPAAVEVRLKVMTQLAFESKSFEKAVGFGKQWMATHPDDTAMLDLIARASYIGNDFKAALDTLNTAIGIAESNGKTPNESWLKLLPSCSARLEDQAGVLAGYAKLVRYYPKPEYWTKSLELLLSIDKSDAAQLYILRLMADTGVLTKPEYYLEYSQRAIDKAMPGEAAKAMEEGFEKKALGVASKDKERDQRELATARDKAKADRSQLPEIEKEVRTSKANTGQVEVGLGLAYFSHQMYQEAVPMLESGIAKGGLRNLDDVRMMLGIANLRLGQKENAREEFKKASANAIFAKTAPFWISRTYN